MTISLSHFITQQFSPCLSHSPPVLSSHFLEGLKLCLSPQLHVSSARLTSFLPRSLEDVAMIFRLEMGMDSSDTMMFKRAILAVPGQHPAHPVVLQALETHLTHVVCQGEEVLLSCCICWGAWQVPLDNNSDTF